MHFLRRTKFRVVLLTLVLIFPILLGSLTVFVWAKSPGTTLLTDLTTHNQIPENNTTDLTNIDIAEDYKYEVTGTASYYGKRFHNRTTANGEKYDMYGPTAAHKKLPFNTIIRVTNVNSGKSAIIRINDRGPYVGRRILDLSYHSAKEIDGVGLPKIKIEALLPGKTPVIREDSINYFFGYSFDKPLLCIPENSMNVLDSTTRFEEALKIYKNQIDLDPYSDYYLFVPANNDFRRENKKSGIRYYIAEINKEYEDPLNLEDTRLAEAE